MKSPPLDAIDTKILDELQRDARITMAELARRVHLSQPSVRERVQKLEGSEFASEPLSASLQRIMEDIDYQI